MQDRRVIRTPDQRVRVFVSSTLGELAPERAVVRRTIEQLALTPVMFELGARPHPPRVLYRAYLEQSDIFVGIYWERYGWVAPGEELSGLEDEYQLSAGLPRLLYVKQSQNRQPRLVQLLQRLQDDDSAAYKHFEDPAELAQLLTDDIMLLLTERFEEAALQEASPPDGALRFTPPPLPLTPLIGREAETAMLDDLLRNGTRLCTVTGLGGVGKTRLAVEVCHRLRPSRDVHFVSLAAFRSESQVLPHVAETLGIPLEGSCSAADLIADGLVDAHLLLALDNVEQVADIAVELLTILDRCAGVQLLLTSRQPLRLRGEREFPVQPLPLPQPDSQNLDHSNPCIQLFMERASALRPGYSLTDDDAEPMRELCRRLDGLPLALELAAAQVRLFTPAALVRRLTNVLDVLASRSPDIPEHQRTLRATLDWSYGMLSVEDRQFFARLAVFSGGWTLEAAEAVCGEGMQDVTIGLDSLLEKSLISISEESVGGEPRLRMLEVVRQYAYEHLDRQQEAAIFRQRHAAYFLDLVEEHELDSRTSAHAVWFERLDADIVNLRAAVRWFIETQDWNGLARLQRSTFIYQYVRGQIREMRAWLRQADLDDPSLTPGNRGQLLMDTALAVFEGGDVEHALELSDKALRDFRSAADQPGLVSALVVSSYTHLANGDLVVAARHAEQAWRQARSWPDDPWRQVQAGVIDAMVALVRGDLAASRRRLDEVLPVARKSDHWPLIGVTLQTVGYAALLEGELDAAIAGLIEGAEWYRRAGFREGVAGCLESLAAVAARRDQGRLGVRCLASASAAREQLGIQPYRHLHRMIAALQSGLRTALGEEGFEAAWAQGRKVDLYTMLGEAENALGH